MSQDNIEYEAKILEINVDNIVKKLQEVGAVEGKTYMFADMSLIRSRQ